MNSIMRMNEKYVSTTLKIKNKKGHTESVLLRTQDTN